MVSNDLGAIGVPGTSTDTDSFNINITNDTPVITVLTGFTTTENVSGNLTGTFTDAGVQDAHTVTIDWGDGSGLQNVAIAAGVLTFSVPHTYADDPTNVTDTYTITVTVSDDDGATCTAVSRTVTVTNTPPTGTPTNNGMVSEGSTTATVSLTNLIDPSAADLASLRF